MASPTWRDSTERGEMAAFFDSTSDIYDAWFLKDVHYLELLASIVRRLKAYAPQDIIDLGCGTGNLTALLAQNFPTAHISGVDVSRDLLKIAADKCSKLPNVDVRVGEMLDTVKHLPAGTSIVACYSLHHLVDSDKGELCAEASRVLGPGSAIVIGDVFHQALTEDTEAARAQAILDLTHARAIYYLHVVGLDRCVFEVEHLPMLLKNDREHLVERGFWSRVGQQHGLTAVVDKAVGPVGIGNHIVELTKREH